MLLVLQKRSAVTVKEFIKHYKLDDPTDTDLLLYVTSLCAASKRGAADQRLEQELVHKYEAPFVAHTLCTPCPFSHWNLCCCRALPGSQEAGKCPREPKLNPDTKWSCCLCQAPQPGYACRLYNNKACIPLAIVNTHATGPLTPHCRLETMVGPWLTL